MTGRSHDRQLKLSPLKEIESLKGKTHFCSQLTSVVQPGRDLLVPVAEK